ncbi:uncharacterized protein LOC8268674 [Ricinus communis]|uniref:Uncharacterized protein n=1 Tax=Ricinus communis TaxID=3988 RepID=B9T365_RICCO|nr:uncharacterized protein LOC8268674 [Ricinus communis]EEF29697.1 conserved hypothetical protein [Ricinus communis]|eukprot:XP_002532684.1 uncharacterized protein LOC8268674 [Ricinus communis]
MQSLSQTLTTERPRLPARKPVTGNATENNRVRRNYYQHSSGPASSPRPRSTCTCSNRPGSVRCSKHGYVLPSDKLRRHHQASREILRRALAPPNRKMSLRWWNFRPTPSRLSNMSMA